MSGQKTKKPSSTATSGAASSTGAFSESSRPHQKRLQSYLLIWADSNINERNANCQIAVMQLRSIINEVKLSTTSAQCINFLNEMDELKAFVILSGAFARELVPKIHHMPRLDTIYIFCGNKQRYAEWAKDWSKIQGIYTEIKPICQLLKKATRAVDHDAIPMSFVSKEMLSSNEQKQNLDQLEPSFMYTLLFKEILLEIKEDDSIALKKMIDYCREKQGIVESELKYFESSYKDKSPIYLYTCEIFLYGMINHALRSLQMETMTKLGFFIRNLHHQLTKLHREQSNQFKEKFDVYRGQGLSQEDFNHLSSVKGGLLSFNNFLSTSKLPQVSMEFIERKLYKHPEKVCVLFIMTIDREKLSSSSFSSTPFALIDDESAIPSEQEILFSMHTVFRIDDIQQTNENKQIYQVQLTLTDDNDQQLNRLTQQMREEIGGVEWHRMGQLMINVGDFNGAEQLYMELINDTSDEQNRSLYFDRLATAKQNQGEYEEAVKYYTKSIEIDQRTLDKNHPDLSASYNNIASVYNRMGEYSKALEYYEKSIEITKISLPKNHPNLATSYNNIALVYNDMGDYSKALEYYEKSHKIYEISLPENHPSLSASYNNIGLVYNDMGEYSKALEYHEKSIEITKISLPKNHPDLANSYSTIGQVYNNMGEYSKALEYYEKSHKIFEISLPKNHPNLAISYSNIGQVYNDMGQYSKALEYHEKSVEIKKISLPNNHPNLATSYSNIGQVYDNMGEYSKALEYYEKSIEITKISLPKNHPELATSYNNIALVYNNMGEYSKALEYYEKSHKIYEISLPENHPNLAISYSNTGQVYNNMGEMNTQKHWNITRKTSKSRKYLFLTIIPIWLLLTIILH